MNPSLSDRMERWARQSRVGVTVVAVLWVTAVGLQVQRDRVYAVPRVNDQTLYFRSGEVLGRMALSFDTLLADVYWIRALQHYGRTRGLEGTTKSYDQLYPLLDITTTLDPRFNIAYRFGAIFLTEAYPDGPGRPDQALALLEKGWQAMPERWEYLMDMGFVYYWWLGDYEEAARWFQRASEVPGSSWWLQTLAANTLAEGGNRQGSRLLWRQVLESASDEWLRNEATRRLLQLDALDDTDQYTAVAVDFEAAQGYWPRSWRELVADGGVETTPLDPVGYPYVIDPVSRRVTLSPESPLLPLPVAPAGGRSQ